MLIILVGCGVLLICRLARLFLRLEILAFFRRDDWRIQYGLYLISGVILSASSEFSFASGSLSIVNHLHVLSTSSFKKLQIY